MKRRQPITINLPIGYADKEGRVHTSVTIAHALKGSDFLSIAHALQGQSGIAYTVQLLCASITRFGSLPMPVTSSILLSLDSVDLDDLMEAHSTFYESCGNPVIKDSSVKIVFGIEIGGAIFDVAEFDGNAADETYLQAKRRGLDGAAAFAFIAGQHVTRLRQSDGDKVIEGPLNLAQIMRLDSIDLLAITTASGLWQKLIRLFAGLAGVSEEDALDIAASGGPAFERAISQLSENLNN